MFNVAGTTKFTMPTEIPDNNSTFTKNFLVSPHVGRTGAGRIHLHFNLPEQYTIATLKQNQVFLQYLQQNDDYPLVFGHSHCIHGIHLYEIPGNDS